MCRSSSRPGRRCGDRRQVAGFNLTGEQRAHQLGVAAALRVADRVLDPRPLALEPLALEGVDRLDQGVPRVGQRAGAIAHGERDELADFSRCCIDSE